MMNGILDKSSVGRTQAEIPVGWRAWLDQRKLIDIWRNQQVQKKDYTYYASKHQSYSRIDYVFQ